MTIPTIRTPRLILRAFTAKDVVPLCQILRGEGVLRYFPVTEPPTLERAESMIRRVLKQWEEHGYGLWAVVSRQTQELMGRAGLQTILETGEVEADVILGVPYWGQGFATEALEASLRFAAEQLTAAQIVGIVHPENKASQHLLEKVGLTFAEEAVYFGMKCHRYVLVRRTTTRPAAGGGCP